MADKTTTSYTIHEPRTRSEFGAKVAQTFKRDTNLARILVLGSDADRDSIVSQYAKVIGETLIMQASDVSGAKVAGHCISAAKSRKLKLKRGVYFTSDTSDEVAAIFLSRAQ